MPVRLDQTEIAVNFDKGDVDCHTRVHFPLSNSVTRKENPMNSLAANLQATSIATKHDRMEGSRSPRFQTDLSDSGHFISELDSKSSYEVVDTDDDIDLDIVQIGDSLTQMDFDYVSSASDDDADVDDENNEKQDCLSRHALLFKAINKSAMILFPTVVLAIAYCILLLLSVDGIILQVMALLPLIGCTIYLAGFFEFLIIRLGRNLVFPVTLRLLASNHFRYFITLIVLRATATSVLRDLEEHLKSEINRSLLALIVVDFLWMLWMTMSQQVLGSLKKSAFGKDVHELVLQERGLQRLCCQTQEDLVQWVAYEKNNSKNSIRHFNQRAARIIKGSLILPLQRVVKTKQRSRTVGWKFSISSMLGIKSASEMDQIVDFMWKNLINRSGSESVASIQEWNQLFNNKKLGQKSFCHLFQRKQRDQEICHELTFSDLSKAVNKFFHRRYLVQSNLWNWESLSHVTLNLSQTLFWLCMIFVVSALYGVPMSGVMVTLSSLMLSLAFAFGSVASSMVNSAIFIFVSKPFDVGDVVRIGSDRRLMTVASIDLLTTSFVAIDNQRVMIYNAKLMQENICNLRRTSTAWVEFIFEVSFHTSKEKLDKLREHIASVIKGKEGTWKKKMEFFVSSPVKTHSMFLNIWLENRINFQSVLGLARAKTEIINTVREKIGELGIHCDYPVRTLRFENEHRLMHSSQHEA